MKECSGLYDRIIADGVLVHDQYKEVQCGILPDSQFFGKTIVEVTYLNDVSGDNTYLQTEFPFPEMKKLEIESQDWETTETS